MFRHDCASAVCKYMVLDLVSFMLSDSLSANATAIDAHASKHCRNEQIHSLSSLDASDECVQC